MNFRRRAVKLSAKLWQVQPRRGSGDTGEPYPDLHGNDPIAAASSEKKQTLPQTGTRPVSPEPWPLELE